MDNFARLRIRQKNIERYQRLLKTKLTDSELEFVEVRLSEERLAILQFLEMRLSEQRLAMEMFRVATPSDISKGASPSQRASTTATVEKAQRLT